MIHPAILVAAFVMALVMLLAAAFLLGWRMRRRKEAVFEMSPVTRQHIDLFQGGQLSESAIESAKSRFRAMLERGDWQGVEACLRPGTHYVIQVRALAEIGTDDAGRILERQLQRRLSNDVIEQSWYWIDLANGLRNLNREQSLPQLLRCAETSGDHPLCHFFAAETVCFMSFAGFLRQPESTMGRSALRVLHRALEGLRCGLQPQVVIEAKLGEMIESLWDHRPEKPSPLIARVFLEALRVLRRAPHAEILMADEQYEQEAFSWQMSHLAALEPALTEYLSEAKVQLVRDLAHADGRGQKEILHALDDLRGDAAESLLPMLQESRCTDVAQAVAVLAWSRDSRISAYLREWVHRRIPVVRRAKARKQASSPRKRSIPDDVPYASILRALRGHGSKETEIFLLLASRDWDPTIRAAALSSLGWWEPYRREQMNNCLKEARCDASAEVRQMARAALARLGELQALQWFRQALTSQDTVRVHEAIQVVSREGLVLLWPDLDHLADSENVDIALHACEALERMREEHILQT